MLDGTAFELRHKERAKALYIAMKHADANYQTKNYDFKKLFKDAIKNEKIWQHELVQKVAKSCLDGLAKDLELLEPSYKIAFISQNFDLRDIPLDSSK